MPPAGVAPRPYGVGLAYRFVIHDAILANRDRIDVLEIPTEDYIVRSRLVRADPDQALLREAAAAFPCVAHGISLSIGSVEAPPRHVLEETRRLLDAHGVDAFSEHLAFHRAAGADLRSFLAMPFDEVAVEWVRRRVGLVREALGRQVTLENVSYPFGVPGGGFDEADFVGRVAEAADCALLLDVTNVYNNAFNHGYDPIELIRRLPGERVTQIHVAGGHFEGGQWLDSHSRPVMEGVWRLLDEALRVTAAEVVIVERDSNFQPFEALMRDVDLARAIFYRRRPARPPEAPAGPRAPAGPAPAADPDDPAFADLRAFQRALMGRITDPALRSDPDAAAAQFGLDGAWAERLRGCDPGELEKLGHSWRGVQAADRAERREYERVDWGAWQRALAGPEAGRGPLG